MKKLLWVGAVGVAVFAFVAVAKAQDVGFENIFGSSVSVDLKVNGSDGPVKVDRGERIVVSWISEGATRCRGNWSKNDIKLSGTVAGKISKSVLVKVACINGEGDRDDDSVVVNVSGQTAVTTPIPVEQKEQKLAVFVASPEFGASVYEGDTISVLWRTNGTSGGDITLPTSISLRSIADGKSIELWRGGNSGAQKVTIPPQVLAPGQTGGKYEIDVTISANGRSFVGTSSVFSVIDPTQKPVPTTSAQPLFEIKSMSVYSGAVGTEVKLYTSGLPVAINAPQYFVEFNNQFDAPATVDSNGTFTFKIPNNPQGTYKIVASVYGVDSNKYATVNGRILTNNALQFTITAPTTSAQPSITVTSPWAGGEKWAAGSNQTVRWSTTDIPVTNNMVITLVGKAYDKDLGNAPNIGYQQVTIPANLTAGDYQIVIRTVGKAIEYSASSPVYITTAPTTSAQPTITVDLKVDKGDGPTNGPVTVAAGTSIGLSYTTTGKIDQCNGDVTGDSTGSIRTTVQTSKTFAVTCLQDGGDGKVSDSVTVNVTQPTTTTTTPTTSGTPSITVTGPLNSYGAPTPAFVTFTSSGVSTVKVEACVNKTDCTVISSASAVSGSSETNIRWDIVGNEPFVGATGTKPIYLKVTDLASGVFDFTDSYIYVTPPVSGAAGSNLAGASVPGDDVWNFLKGFFGGR